MSMSVNEVNRKETREPQPRSRLISQTEPPPHDDVEGAASHGPTSQPTTSHQPERPGLRRRLTKAQSEGYHLAMRDLEMKGKLKKSDSQESIPATAEGVFVEEVGSFTK